MDKKPEDIEIKLLFEAMYMRYGYDFRSYSYASAKRRVLFHVQKNHLPHVSALMHWVLHDAHAADNLLLDLSINVTEMFRDPLFFKYLRNKILPQFSSLEHIKIWHAGCSSGEEVYSMAILLHELNELVRSQLYATDFNESIIKQAQAGIINLKEMKNHIGNYQKSGGTADFSDYYFAQDDHALLDKKLKTAIMFANHNLTEDASFGEMSMIVCRNVLIYFNKELQQRVFKLFDDSLDIGGYLCLGSHETLKFSDIAQRYETVSKQHRIYKKVVAQ